MSAALPQIEDHAEPPELMFNYEQSAWAHDTWNATCGPHSIAAATGKSLEEVRAILTPKFKGWMNPTMLAEALKALDVPHTLTNGLVTKDLCHGINRIQFEGPWLKPGVPAAAAYAHTHWVARMGYGVLCTMACHHHWIPIDVFWDWHLAHSKPMHITHHYAFASRS